MRLGRRSFLAAAGAAAVACVAPTGAPPARGTLERLVLSWWTDTGHPSPFTFSTVGPGGVVKVMLLFDTLTWKDPSGIIPWLARSWSVEAGGTAYRFELRDDATFSDERPVTTEDVAVTFGYLARHPYRWAPTDVVAAAEALSPRTVVVRLRRPFAPFIEDVAGAVPILPRHVWERVADPLRYLDPASVVGSGPYTLASHAPARGEYLFRARDRHFAGAPLVRELAYVVIPPAQTAIALRTRAADTFLATTYDVVPAFATGEPYRVLATQPFSSVRLLFNVDRAPLDDRRVRRAIAHALDRADIAARATRAPDAIVGSAGIIPPESPWAATGLPTYAFDPGLARRILDEAGLADADGDGLRELPDGRGLVLDLLADPAAPELPLIVAALRAVGLATRHIGGDPKTRTELQGARRFSLALASHIGVGGDPDFLRRWYAGDVANAFEAGNVLHSPELDRLAAEQVAELDPARRREIVHRMQRVLAEELPTITLYHRRFYFLYDATKWDRWANTSGGILNGIPLLENKVAFLAR